MSKMRAYTDKPPLLIKRVSASMTPRRRKRAMDVLERFNPEYIRSKTTFSFLGVIFSCEDGAVRLTHWPHCGMDAKTCRRFASWLLKRAGDLEKAP